MSVKVSKSAYKDLVTLQKFIIAAETKFVKFPETSSKWASINELLKKNVIVKKGHRKTSLYALGMPLENVIESSRKTKVLAPKIIISSETSASTLKLDFYLLKEFVKNVEESSRNLGMSKNNEIERRISDMSVALAKTKNREERSLLIKSLVQADNALHNLGTTALAGAIKDVAAASKYRAFNLDDLISVNSPSVV